MRFAGRLIVLACLALGACAPTATEQGAPAARAAGSSPSTELARSGFAALARHDYAAAASLGERALAAASTARERSQAMTVRGVARIALGDERAGMAEVEQAIAADPTYSVAYFARGRFRYDARDYAGAARDFRTAIQYQDRIALFYLWYTLASAQTGDFREAQASADRLVRLQPAQAGNWAIRGLIHEIQGNFATAASDYRSALSIDPRNREAAAGMERLRQRAQRGGGPRPSPAIPTAPRGPRVVDL